MVSEGGHLERAKRRVMVMFPGAARTSGSGIDQASDVYDMGRTAIARRELC